MALDTVAEYVAETRTLLQDSSVGAYRYSDADLLKYLNLALMEARRLRPDLFLLTSSTPPSYAVVDNTVVALDQQYRSTMIYYMVSRAQLRDEEDTSDQRASALNQKFAQQLIGLPG